MQLRTLPVSLLFALAAAFISWPQLASACGDHDHPHPLEKEVTLHGRRRSLLSITHRRCGSISPSHAVKTDVHAKVQMRMAIEAAQPASSKVTIPVYVTVVSPLTSKSPVVTDQQIKEQIALMNTAYSAGAAKAKTQWIFKLAGVTKIKAGDMCDTSVEAILKKQYRKGAANALNLYFTDLSSCGLLGYSTWPWDLQKKGLHMDGVVIDYGTLPGGYQAPYNKGRTAIHETGHWIGLLHTFENGCKVDGDQVADTPYEAIPASGCPAKRKSCPLSKSVDPVHNFMDYSDDSCMDQFTPGQQQRMWHIWQMYRLAA